MPTPEVVYCFVTSSTRGNHLARTERVREEDGAATQHRHNSLTLCGAKIEKLYPFFSADWACEKRVGGICPDCSAKWLKDRRGRHNQSVARAVLP
ncbi:MAG: hypothetical protein JWP89_3665 [Schlesneria sp.]|nr:hypothetical protein [Schlesneria sp.]